MTAAAGATIRRRLAVTGVVQGVGFRPFVHRLATGLGLAGTVGNGSSGVIVEVEGREDDVESFVARLRTEAPPLARIESVTAAVLDPVGATGFDITASVTEVGARTLVPPDVAVCADCLRELADPGDRRYRYPFTNCTNCGPRFTIIRGLPYDRPATTMAGFEMCAACRAEYEDPGDRRHHAQPIACPVCGPQIAFVRGDDRVPGTDPALRAFHRAVDAGQVVSVKGIGGHHLACDARSDSAVAALRSRKGRADKPFAVMVPDLAAARVLAEIDDDEAAVLTSAAHPIVLVRRRPGAAVSRLVAPGSPVLGIVLPYSPLHHLLFAPVPGDAGPTPEVLVVTSANPAGEPICSTDDVAGRLGHLADAHLVHDRPIEVPCDDSVVRVVDGEEQPVRRARGYAPLPARLPVELVPTLAVGAELKNTFCLAAGRHAWVSQHIGDMGSLETLAAFERGATAFERWYGVEPEVLACDAHPGYLTHRWAHAHAAGRPVVEVQHHHAHVAAVMAEHHLGPDDEVVGFAFDGTGYGRGDDGRDEIWGGEVLVAGWVGAERVGHLRPFPLPGGDAAVRHPCRVAAALLLELGLGLDQVAPGVLALDGVELDVVRRQVEGGIGCVPATSMGRLFDAVASLLGVRHRISYEAQAAIELEMLATQATGVTRPRWAFAIDDRLVLDPGPVVRGLLDDLGRGADVADLAHGFHLAVAAAVVATARAVRASRGTLPVVLTGGVFQNDLLARHTRAGLEEAGFTVLVHRAVPPNDGGIALGQAVVAGHARRREVG